MGLTYSIITPALDDAETLPTLARSEEKRRPLRCVIVGAASLGLEPDIVVNMGEDVTMEPVFSSGCSTRLRDPSLAIGSGSAWERGSGLGRQHFVTAGTHSEAGLYDDPLVRHGSWSGVDRDARQGQDTIVVARH